jgi:hypothetical protein
LRRGSANARAARRLACLARAKRFLRLAVHTGLS